jgi:hypothetical protein
VRPSRSVEIAFVESVAFFGIGLSRTFLKTTKYLALSDMSRHCEYYTDVPAITAFGKEIAQVPRAVTRLLEIGDAPVIHDPSSCTGQLLARNGRVFSNLHTISRKSDTVHNV